MKPLLEIYGRDSNRETLLVRFNALSCCHITNQRLSE
jgi:hypothetical protein